MASFTVENRGAVALVTFRRPPRNLMDMASMTELEGVLTGLAADPAVTVVVLTGGVPGYFVAHADVGDLAKLGRGEPVEGDPSSWGRVTALLESMPQPVIAAIDGQAWGGGCELALACTLRIASASAHLGQPEILVGIIPGAGGTQRLPRLVGAGRAAELVLTGRIVDASEAHRIGLVELVLPDEDFLAQALAVADSIASRSRTAVLAAKRALVDGIRLPLDEALALETRLFLECQLGPDAIALEQAAAERYAEADDDERVTLDP